MRKFIFPVLLLTAGAIVLTSCIGFPSATKRFSDSSEMEGQKHNHHIVYFNPEIYPNIDEIKFASYQAFFDGVTDKLGKINHMKITRVDTPLVYDSVDAQTIRDICKNNNSDLAFVPKIKYFKVGIGKYVFSNQVIISMKMYDAQGNFITESSYDTFKKNKRIMGSTENSIKIGADGVMKDMLKEIRQINRHADAEKNSSEKGISANP